jgi:hypothetical protein
MKLIMKSPIKSPIKLGQNLKFTNKFNSLGLHILQGFVVSLMAISPIWAGETTITGENGKTTKVNTDRVNNGDTSTVNRNVTYPNNSTSNSTGNFTNNGNGSYTGTVDRTNRAGNTNTYNLDGQITKDGNTRQNTGTITGTNGKQTTFNNTGSCTNGTCTGDRNLTFQNGKTRNTSLTGQRLGRGNYTGTGTVTGRNGNSRSGSFARNR